MKYSPSCNCCDVACVNAFNAVTEGVTDYRTRTDEEIGLTGTGTSGEWVYGISAGIGYVEASVITGLFGIDAAASNPGNRNFEIECKLTPNGVGNNVWRIAVGTDEANNSFVEALVTKSGSLYYLQVLIGKVVAGADTYLAKHPDSAISYPFILSSGIKAIGLGLNFDAAEGALTGYFKDGGGDVVSSAIAFSITARSQSPPGDYAFIFTKTVNGTIRFRRWNFSNCGTFQSCTRGVGPTTILVTIDDPGPATHSFTQNASCKCPPAFPANCPDPSFTASIKCDQLLGTHALPRAGTYIGDGVCVYGEVGIIEGLIEGPGTGTGTDGCTFDHELVNMSLSITRGPTGHTRILTLTIQSYSYDDCTDPGGPGNYGFTLIRTIATFTGTTEVAMEEWVDDIPLTRQLSGGEYGCATPAMTVLVNSA